MIYDVLVIGGGPAGMIAAGQAGKKGYRTLLLEKNNDLGIKLLITGHGRCNITNISADAKETLPAYGVNYKFLYSTFNRFDVDSTLEFFNQLGLKTKTEEHGRVFPRDNKARSVQSAMHKYLKENQVEIRLASAVKSIKAKNHKIEKVILERGAEIKAKNYIIATGGKSYPQTGSSGDAYQWLEKLGHKVNTPQPALSPLIIKEKTVKMLEGASFESVVLSVYQANKKVFVAKGAIIFTAEGLSGPAIIDMSGRIGDLLDKPVFLIIDFLPDIEAIEFEKKLQIDFHNSHNKFVKNYLATKLPPKLVPAILRLTEIDPEKPVNVISKIERKALVKVLKAFRLEIKAVKGFDKAMITKGGIDTREVDPKTMRSLLFPNLFFAGEVLDIDGPSGGYNLQICWSTGYTAGDNIFS